jgi:hypothetical protein
LAIFNSFNEGFIIFDIILNHSIASSVIFFKRWDNILKKGSDIFSISINICSYLSYDKDFNLFDICDTFIYVCEIFSIFSPLYYITLYNFS